ncbi:MAG: ferrochelatase [Gammaproteobacteria bacterium]|nr:ferrochelatase [Gammaproteobacteria bacterium]
MSAYQGETNYQHGQAEPLGVLLVNLGTPDAPTKKALQAYLGEFLADPRVVELSRLIWLPILHGVILRFRPNRSAKAYAKVWSEAGSPLLAISKRQTEALQKQLSASLEAPVKVQLAMRYGNPSIKAGLQALQVANVRRVLVLPLYPQYSATTTASVFDGVAKVLQKQRWIPELRFINQYFQQPAYIKALADSVRQQWAERGQGDKLLLSFHGIPKKMHLAGDPYYCHCQATGHLLAQELELQPEQWQLVFQSRFGREEWLKPYASLRLQELAKEGVKTVDVVCPGFSADCLETLEEIAMENRELFIEAGGEDLRYIPALNDRPEHIEFLAQLVTENMAGWLDVRSDEELGGVRERALADGA